MEGVNGTTQVRATSFTSTIIPPNILAKCEEPNWGAQDLEATTCKPRKSGQVGSLRVRLRSLRPGLGVHAGQDCAEEPAACQGLSPLM